MYLVLCTSTLYKYEYYVLVRFTMYKVRCTRYTRTRYNSAVLLCTSSTSSTMYIVQVPRTIVRCTSYSYIVLRTHTYIVRVRCTSYEYDVDIIPVYISCTMYIVALELLVRCTSTSYEYDVHMCTCMYKSHIVLLHGITRCVNMLIWRVTSPYALRFQGATWMHCSPPPECLFVTSISE